MNHSSDSHRHDLFTKPLPKDRFKHMQPDVRPEKLLAFLSRPESYAHRPTQVHIIQTHISYVAIASPLVFKVKKAVDMGFLDFSTLSRRKFFCDEEVRLNRRLCPDTYEAVVPIRLSEGALTFGETGDVVEYAVRMKQLHDGRFLHQLLQAGKVDNEDLDRIVARLVAFYAGVDRSPGVAEWGRIERLRVSTDENFEQTVGHVGTFLTQASYDALRFYVTRFFERHGPLFSRRRTQGHIVDGHGDLRLEHVHLSPDRICIYDCIEFNERLRFIDIANDVAFLAMDFDYYDRPDLASTLAQRIASALQDSDLLKLMAFYKCYRAYVRGKVEGMRSNESEVPEDERAASRVRARRYYQLAMRYAAVGDRPLVIVIMGRVGTGKSTQATALGEALGWPVVSSDTTRKQLAGVPLHRRGDAAERSRLYSKDLTDLTYKTLRDNALRAARKWLGTILDATYGSSRERQALRDSLDREGVGYRFVELEASDSMIQGRLRDREGATDVVSDARIEDFSKLDASYQAPGPEEHATHVTVSSEDPPSTSTRKLFKHLIGLRD